MTEFKPTLSFVRRFFGHLSTISTHKWLVFKLCCRAGLYWQGFMHDWSKFSPTEFWRGVKYFQGYRSPNAAEREDIGYSAAWLHHKGRNRHHFEYWTDIALASPEMAANGTRFMYGPIRMPVKYVGEMICDRIAASKVYLKDAYTDAASLEYFGRESAGGGVLMHPQTRELVGKLLELLAREGEDALFAFLQAEVLAKGDAAYDALTQPVPSRGPIVDIVQPGRDSSEA